MTGVELPIYFMDHKDVKILLKWLATPFFGKLLF